MRIIKFLKDNDLIYNKQLMNYKDQNKREALWNKFCTENDIDKAVCKRCFQGQRTIYKSNTNEIWAGCTSSD